MKTKGVDNQAWGGDDREHIFVEKAGVLSDGGEVVVNDTETPS